MSSSGAPEKEVRMGVKVSKIEQEGEKKSKETHF